jgi:hypothetical protein
VPESEVLVQIKALLKSIQMPEQLLGVLLEHMKASHVAKNKFHLGAIAGLRREYDQTRERLATLLDLRLDKSITDNEYDKKARELKEHQLELTIRIEQHQKGDGDAYNQLLLQSVN